MNNNKTLEKWNAFIEFFDAWTKEDETHIKRALFLALKSNVHHLATCAFPRTEHDRHYFHKGFRQADVCSTWEQDMLIWHLLNATGSFFEAAKQFNKQWKPERKKSKDRATE